MVLIILGGLNGTIDNIHRIVFYNLFISVIGFVIPRKNRTVLGIPVHIILSIIYTRQSQQINRNCRRWKSLLSSLHVSSKKCTPVKTFSLSTIISPRFYVASILRLKLYSTSSALKFNLKSDKIPTVVLVLLRLEFCHF